MIRLLALDIDGTLLRKDRTVHPDNVEAIRRAQDAGIRVVLSSGRLSSGVRSFSHQLGLGDAMICCNGGYVVGDDNVDLLCIGLEADLIVRTLEYTESTGVHINAYSRDQIYILRTSDWLEKYCVRVRTAMPVLSSVEEIHGMHLLKIILIDEPTSIQRHYQALDSLFGSLAALTESEPEYLELLPPTANKGRGLEVLSQSFGIAQHETAAIGDYLNDLEMIQWAGIGAAVGNAAAQVKAIANLQVPTNDEAGVAYFIDYLIASNRDSVHRSMSMAAER